MATLEQAIAFVANTEYKYYTYGLVGSDLGTPIDREYTLDDLQHMGGDDWGDGEIYPCDEHGNIIL